MKISELIGEYFCDLYEVEQNQQYKIETIDPKELIVSDRLDLIAKIKYLEFKNNNRDMNFISEVYKKHIEAITNGSYTERGNKEKNSILKYVEVFEEIEKSILENQFDKTLTVIPVAENNAIMDGAHRTAVCAYHDKPISIVRLPKYKVKNDADFYKQRLLDTNIIDYLVTEYTKFKDNVYVACLWPKAASKEKRIEAENIIKKSANVIYSKEILLSENGLRNLMIQIYREHEWMGSVRSHFKGATNKSSQCYEPDIPVKIYILENINFDSVLKLKDEVRDIFKVGKHSIHITDTKREAIQIINLLLNENSISLMNNGKPDRYVELNIKIQEFKDKVLKSGKSLDDFIIDSSSVMGLYGLRETNDIDFLTHKDYKEIEGDGIESHNSYLKYYKVPLDDLLYNPNNYLVYNEVKFINLDKLKIFKENRMEEKDLLDIKLINAHLDGKFDLKGFLYKKKLPIKRKIRKIKNSIQKTPLYKPLKIIKDFIVK